MKLSRNQWSDCGPDDRYEEEVLMMMKQIKRINQLMIGILIGILILPVMYAVYTMPLLNGG